MNNYGHNPPVAQRTAVPSRQTATRAPGKNNAATRLANRQAKNHAGHGRDIEYSLALPARHANSVDSRPATDSEVRSGSFDGEVRTLRPALKLGDPRARSKCDDNTSRTAAFWAGSSKKPFSNLDEFAKVGTLCPEPDPHLPLQGPRPNFRRDFREFPNSHPDTVRPFSSSSTVREQLSAD